MKTLLPCALAVSLLLTHHHAAAQQKNTPPPFPGWTNKGTPAAGSGAVTDNKDFLGEWEGFITEGDGSNPGQRRGNISLNVTKDYITSTGGGAAGGGNYKITGGSGKFRKIDASGTDGQYRNKQYEGIFLIEGNTLKWCSGNPGKGRPSELKTSMGAGHFLMVLTRKN
jgi:uncharacterized protein (TIGR03067 family)